MAEFNDREELEAWLKDRPREVSVVIAARAALRVLPLLAVEISEGKLNLDAIAGGIALPIFRATAVPWVAAKYPTHGMELATAAATAPAYADAAAATAAPAYADAAAATAAAAAAATSWQAVSADAAAVAGTGAASAADAASAAVVAVYEASAANAAADDDWDTVDADTAVAADADALAARVAIWDAISADATMIENSMAPDELAGHALWDRISWDDAIWDETVWDGNAPGWAKPHRTELKQTLLGLDADWRVWTDWYEARLVGRPTYPDATAEQNERLEIARATIEIEIWDEGPAAVNAEIKRLEKEFLGEEWELGEKEPESGPGPGMVEFKDRDGLKAWLEGQPPEVSVVIATRAVLRVLPLLLAVEFSEGKLKPDAVAREIVLPVFRAAALAWATSKYPGDGIGSTARYAGEAEFLGADNVTGITAAVREAAYAADAIAGRAPAVSGGGRAYLAIRTAAAAAQAFAAIDTDTNIDQLTATIWEAVEADATRIENDIVPEKLAGEALWDNETPDWVVKYQDELEYRLLGLDPDWVVWTGWYASRLAGRSTYPRFNAELNEKTEFARANIGGEIYDKGPVAVFAEIKRREKEFLGSEPGEKVPKGEIPPEPEPGPGPEYAPKAGKLAAVAHIPLEAESEQSSKLHEQLRKKAKDFSRVIGPAENQYPELAEAATEYTELVDVPTGQLDVVAVWSVGGALAAFSGSYREQNQTRTMASPLEPQLAAKLASLIRDHGAFILGFEEGRDLVDRADRFALQADVIREIETPGNVLLNELTDNRALVDEETRKIHEPVRNAAVELGWTGSRVGYSAYLIVRKAVFAMIKFIFHEGRSPAEIVAILAGTPVAISALAGDPSAEFIRAAVPVLREHGGHLLSFFNHSPEFRAYVEWALGVLDADDEVRNKE